MTTSAEAVRRRVRPGVSFRSGLTFGRDSAIAGPSAKNAVLKTASATAAIASRHDGSTTTSMPSGSALDKPRGERARRPPADDETGGRSKRRQRQPLDQQLPHDPRAAAAQRLPDRDLPAAGGSAREQQVGEIEAGDDQHQRRPSASAARKS